MFVSFLSPLAPAAILLLSAFVLFIMPSILPSLPMPRRTPAWLPHFLAPALVGVAILSLLITHFTVEGVVTGGDLVTSVADWPLSTEAIALEFRADSLSVPFLILILLLLLIVALPSSSFMLSRETTSETVVAVSTSQWRAISGWLLVGAALCAAAVSVDMVTMSAVIIVADVLLMAYWLKQNRQGLAIARLFLSLLSTGAIVVNGALLLSDTPTTVSGSLGMLLMGGALWTRLGLLPFVEITEQGREDDEQSPIYLSLSLVLGLILLGRTLGQPLPAGMLWLTGLMMVLSGLLAWLTDRLPLQFFYLIVVETLLLLLVGPLPSSVVAAAGLMLILSLMALWVTPRLGRPDFRERAWLWPYLPAAAATATVVGLPLFLGWPVRLAIYERLISLDSIGLTLLGLLAEMLAWSSLVRFWQELWPGEKQNQRRLMIGVIVMVPFLLPGLGPLVLERVTQLRLPAAEVGQSSLVLILILVLAVGAVALQRYREQLLAPLKVSPTALIEWGQLRWLWPLSTSWLQRLGQLFLRVEVIFEGQHYLGWAIFATIIGALIILLRV